MRPRHTSKRDLLVSRPPQASAFAILRALRKSACGGTFSPRTIRTSLSFDVPVSDIAL
jgi:hypothetical protein